MTCTEFEKYLPDLIDGETRSENAAHLKECAACAELVSDLQAICNEARNLEAACEPSPRVWANIQRTLEAEGLIRPALQPGGVLSESRPRSLAAWLLPLTALIVLGVGALVYSNRPKTSPLTTNNISVSKPPVVTPKANQPDDADDEQLLSEVAPSMRATYADNLRSVNAFIQDAQDDLKQNPDDDDARHFLMEAYEQKESVYDLAMSRSMQ
jgi:hypothetical protein